MYSLFLFSMPQKVRFKKGTKTHDGLCTRSEILKTAFLECVRTGRSSMLDLMIDEPDYHLQLYDLASDLNDIIERIETGLPNTPLLIGGGSGIIVSNVAPPEYDSHVAVIQNMLQYILRNCSV